MEKQKGASFRRLLFVFYLRKLRLRKLEVENQAEVGFALVSLVTP